MKAFELGFEKGYKQAKSESQMTKKDKVKQEYATLKDKQRKGKMTEKGVERSMSREARKIYDKED